MIPNVLESRIPEIKQLRCPWKSVLTWPHEFFWNVSRKCVLLKEENPLHEWSGGYVCRFKSSSITMRCPHVIFWGFVSCPGNPCTMEKSIFHCKYLAGEWHADVAPAFFLLIWKKGIWSKISCGKRILILPFWTDQITKAVILPWFRWQEYICSFHHTLRSTRSVPDHLWKL